MLKTTEVEIVLVSLSNFGPNLRISGYVPPTGAQYRKDTEPLYIESKNISATKKSRTHP